MAALGAFLGQMEPARMTDTGMWIWAGIILALSLMASYFVAIAWKRWKDKPRAGEP